MRKGQHHGSVRTQRRRRIASPFVKTRRFINILPTLPINVRIQENTSNLENTLNSFNDGGNLLLPSGLIVDHNYDSSISGLQLLPNSEGTGSFIFENVECIQGTYTLIMSDWLGNIYAQEQFSLLP